MGKNSILSFNRLDRRGQGGNSTQTQTFFFLIEPLKFLNYSASLLCNPHHFYQRFTGDVRKFWKILFQPELTLLQGHQESQEQDPQVLLAPLDLVALQVARVFLGWGDHQDPLDIATPLSVLAFLTMDKDTQVHSILSRSCMVLHYMED